MKRREFLAASGAIVVASGAIVVASEDVLPNSADSRVQNIKRLLEIAAEGTPFYIADFRKGGMNAFIPAPGSTSTTYQDFLDDPIRLVAIANSTTEWMYHIFSPDCQHLHVKRTLYNGWDWEGVHKTYSDNCGEIAMNSVAPVILNRHAFAIQNARLLEKTMIQAKNS